MMNSVEWNEGAHGDVWLNSEWENKSTNADPGTLQFHTIMHEIGHALGLVHPTIAALNTHQFTIVS